MANEMHALLCRYDHLQLSHQISVLVAAAFNLTLEYRGLRVAPETEVRIRSEAFNEIQHRLLSQALAQLANKDRYPNDVLFAILAELAQAGDVQASVIVALSNAVEYVESSKT